MYEYIASVNSCTSLSCHSVFPFDFIRFNIDVIRNNFVFQNDEPVPTKSTNSPSNSNHQPMSDYVLIITSGHIRMKKVSLFAGTAHVVLHSRASPFKRCSLWCVGGTRHDSLLTTLLGPKLQQHAVHIITRMICAHTHIQNHRVNRNANNGTSFQKQPISSSVVSKHSYERTTNSHMMCARVHRQTQSHTNGTRY